MGKPRVGEASEVSRGRRSDRSGMGEEAWMVTMSVVWVHGRYWSESSQYEG